MGVGSRLTSITWHELRRASVASPAAGSPDQLPAPVVELPDEGGIRGERLRRREAHRVAAIPEPAQAAKSRDAALGGYPRAGQNGDPPGRRNDRRTARQVVHRSHLGKGAPL